MDSRRFLSIDALRVVALLLMIQTHFVEFLSPSEGPWEFLYGQAVWGIWGVAPAPIFLFVAGLSFWLWYKKQQASQTSEGEIVRTAVRRGIGIFVIGLFFTVTIWLPESVFAWDILTLIGTATLLLAALRKAPSWAFVGLAVAVVLLAPPLRSLTGYAEHWEEAEYLYEFTVSDIVWGFLSHAYFGVLPWLAFPLAGYAMGKHYFHETSNAKLHGWSLPATGAGLVVLGFTGKLLGDGVLPGYTGDMSFYPASTTYMLAATGLCLLALWVLYRLLDAREPVPGGPAVEAIRRYNRFALTTYYVHHAVHLWPIYVLGLIQEQDPWWYYGDAISTPAALILAIVFVIVFHRVLVIWERHGGQFSLEWVLGRFVAAMPRNASQDVTPSPSLSR